MHRRFINIFKSRKQKLTALGFASYEQYLRSETWQKIRTAYAATHPVVCRYCGNPADAINHRSYDRLGSEADVDLEWMCAAHHDEYHERGEILPPTPAQIERLRQWHVAEDQIAKLTRGTAFQLIDDIHNCRILPREIPNGLRGIGA